MLAADGGKPKTTEDLAKACSPQVPAELIGRVMRHMSATLVVREVGAGLWAPTHLSKSLTEPDYEAGIVGLFQTFVPSLALPTLLREKMSPPYSLPTDPHHCAWGLGRGQYGMSLFDTFAKEPKMGKDFADLMRFYTANRQRKFDIYPIDKQLIEGAREGSTAPFMVDLGGSQGADLKDLKARFPQVTKYGPLVNLDRADLIEEQGAQLKAAGLVGFAHDFFKPHPPALQGSRAYFFHQIIHDWSDSLAQDILAQVRDSMEPGYSKLLIADSILPDTKADASASALDMVMMSNVAAKERSEAEFRTLVEGVQGLKVQNVFRGTGEASSDGVMEIIRVA